MHDTFNNEKKFNKVTDKSWYNMHQEPQSAKRGKIKYCKVHNRTKYNFPIMDKIL